MEVPPYERYGSMTNPTHAQDQSDIAALLQGWLYRDTNQWDRLEALFHPDATLEVSWFQGGISEFLDASKGMAVSPFRNKHMISVPVTEVVGDRAYAETNIVVLSEHGELGLGCASHARLLDRIERRDGVWRILQRSASYDMAMFTFPFGIVDIDQAEVRKHPREYAALGYVLERCGYSITRPMATRGSAAEAEIRDSARAWLQS